MSQTTTSPVRGAVRATFTAAFLAVTLAQIANALPGALNGTFQVEFHTTGSELTWVAAMFMIPLVVFELTFGVLGDLFGRKRLLLGGAALVAVGAVIVSLAHTVPVLLIGQAVGGLGAGALFPMSLSMVAALTPDHHARSRVIAAWAGFLSLGAVISPVLAGLCSQLFTQTAADGTVTFSGWRVAYYVTAAIAVVGFIISLWAEDSSAPEGRALDIPGQATFALGLIAVLYATVQGSDTGWGSPDIIGAYVIGALLLGAFIWIELKTKAPLIHLRIFKNRAFTIAGIVALIGMFAFLAVCFSTSVWVGGLQQQETWKIGVLFVFIQGPAFVLIPFVAFLIRRVAPRWVLTTGFLLMAIAGYWLSTFNVDLTHGGQPWTAFIPPLLLLGIGFAFTVGSVTAVAINTVPMHLAGMASATTNLLRDLGFTLGAVLGGAIAFSVGGAVFSGDLAGLAEHLGLSAQATGMLTSVPPLAVLNGWNQIGAALGGMGVDVNAATGPIMGAAQGALGTGFQAVYLTAGVCATVAAMLTLFIGGKTTAPDDDRVAETTEANAEVI
jgi:MFS family permease